MNEERVLPRVRPRRDRSKESSDVTVTHGVARWP